MKFWADSVHSEVTVTPGDTAQQVELELKRTPYGGDLLVRVVDADGQPIEGAELWNQGNSSRNVRTAKTNADGSTLLQNVFKSYAGVVVVAKAPGFVAQEAQATPGTVDDPGKLQFELQPGNTLRGRITDPAGKPMPKLRVYYDRGENGDLKGGRVDTDDDGRFELTGLGPKVIFTVYTPPEYAPVQQVVLRTDLDEVMELKLVPTGLLRVRAIDEETKQPIPSFNVRVGFCEQMQPGDLSPNSLRSTLIQNGVNIQGDVREFRLDNQVPGTALKVIVSAVGYEPTTVARMIAESADIAECVDVALSKEDMRDFQIVAGQLLDADRQPIVGAALRLLNGAEIPKLQVALPGLPRRHNTGWKSYYWDQLKRDDIENREHCIQLLRTVSDKEGRFRFEKVRRDTPWLELYYTGEHLLPQRYSNLRDYEDVELLELELVAERACELKIEVNREAFPRAAKLHVAAVGWNDGISSIKMPYSYEYRELAEENSFAYLPAGDYDISLMTENRPVGNGGFTNDTLSSQSITLEPGQSQTITFE